MAPPSRGVPPCPACGQTTARHLHGISREASVNFYDCGACHHLWAVNKSDPSKVRHVTPFLRPKPDRRSGSGGDI